jgi:branched-chain amino acid transport system permease protein
MRHVELEPGSRRIWFGTAAIGWDNVVYGTLLVVSIIFLPLGLRGSLLARLRPVLAR